MARNYLDEIWPDSLKFSQTLVKEKIIEVVANIMMIWGEGISPQTLQSLWCVKRNGMGKQLHLPSEHHFLNPLLYSQLLPSPGASVKQTKKQTQTYRKPE